MTRKDDVFDAAGASAGEAPLSARDLALWGLNEIAYIRPVELDGRRVSGIFAADGEQIGAAPDAATAAAAAIQEGLTPVWVH